MSISVGGRAAEIIVMFEESVLGVAHLRSGEAFTCAFPLKFLAVGRANEVRITLYLFKAPSGPTAGDIAKVFINSPQRDDDGEYFYGVLPPPSQPAN